MRTWNGRVARGLGRYNITAMSATADRRTGPHWAHVGMVAMHTICCGLPLALSVLGIAASASLFGGVLRFHDILHERELWLLAGSAALVTAGGFAEWRFVRADRGRRISALFAASLACFVLNGAVVAGHRGGAFPVEVAAPAR